MKGFNEALQGVDVLLNPAFGWSRYELQEYKQIAGRTLTPKELMQRQLAIPDDPKIFGFKKISALKIILDLIYENEIPVSFVDPSADHPLVDKLIYTTLEQRGFEVSKVKDDPSLSLLEYAINLQMEGKNLSDEDITQVIADHILSEGINGTQIVGPFNEGVMEYHFKDTERFIEYRRGVIETFRYDEIIQMLKSDYSHEDPFLPSSLKAQMSQLMIEKGFNLPRLYRF